MLPRTAYIEALAHASKEKGPYLYSNGFELWNTVSQLFSCPTGHLLRSQHTPSLFFAGEHARILQGVTTNACTACVTYAMKVIVEATARKTRDSSCDEKSNDKKAHAAFVDVPGTCAVV